MDLANEIALFDFVTALSEAVDLVSPAISDHHKKVAYIAYNIAEEMGLPSDLARDILLAAFLHDVGAFALTERIHIMDALIDELEIAGHAEAGYLLLKDFPPFARLAEIVRYHHRLYDASDDDVPMGAHILHLADRLSVQYDETHELIGQIPTVMARIEADGGKYHPDALRALKQLSRLEYFWIEAWKYPDERAFPDRVRAGEDLSDLDILRGLARVFAQIIDFRSKFTATHSSGVAAVARELSGLAGFSPRECGLMEVAGFLHDLGKLAVPNEVLEKDGKLNRVEFSIVQKHTYYTYVILHRIKGMENLAEWAAFHHERMDGQGYPFHIPGEKLSKLSRVMAVSDVFTAITESRPYREGMQREQAVQLLGGMAQNGALDSDIVRTAKENFDKINAARHTAQSAAQEAYESFA
jgi:HD-GYP domain-containing protein (c-di-GMP phosphodiesterase class II)